MSVCCQRNSVHRSFLPAELLVIAQISWFKTFERK